MVTDLGKNSPSLFRTLTLGNEYSTAVLTQRNAQGQPVAVWAVGTVFITADLIDGQGTRTPKETYHVVFGSITEITKDVAVSWSQVTNTADAPPGPSPSTLSPLPVPGNPRLTLEFPANTRL